MQHEEQEYASAIRARRWCFTINNYCEEDLARCQDAVTDGVCRYICFGLEIAPETGTPHIQGYLECAGQKARRTLSKAFPRAAFFPAKGSAEQNITYCSKEGKFFEDGENPLTPAEDGSLKGQGRRNDIHRVKQIIAEGGGMADIIDECSSYQSLKAGELLLKYAEPTRAVKPVVVWIHGPTGTGKSALASEIAPDAWWTAKSLKWWDGYDAHANVVIDDFRADYCTFHELLRILDRHPYRVETKGGSRQLLATRVVITSPYPPENVYREREDIGQLLRRIDRTIFVEAPIPPKVDPQAEEEYNRELNAVDSILSQCGHSPTVSEVEGNILPAAPHPSGSAPPDSKPQLTQHGDNIAVATDTDIREALAELMGCDIKSGNPYDDDSEDERESQPVARFQQKPRLTHAAPLTKFARSSALAIPSSSHRSMKLPDTSRQPITLGDTPHGLLCCCTTCCPRTQCRGTPS